MEEVEFSAKRLRAVALALEGERVYGEREKKRGPPVEDP